MANESNNIFAPINYSWNEFKAPSLDSFGEAIKIRDDRHYKALQGQAAINKTLQDLGLEYDQPFTRELSKEYNNRINSKIDGSGYAGDALTEIYNISNDIQKNNVIWDKVRDTKKYNSELDIVNKMYYSGAISQATYDRWKDQNKYHSEIKYDGETDEQAIKNRAVGIVPVDEFGNPKQQVGAITWNPNWKPVKEVSPDEIVVGAKRIVEDESGGYETVYFLDANGNYITDFSESVDGIWYKKTGETYTRLPEEKIKKAIETYIGGNQSVKEALSQRYNNEKYLYEKNSREYDNISGYLKEGTKVPYDEQTWRNNLINKLAGLNSKNNVTTRINYNDDALKQDAARRAAYASSITYNPTDPSMFSSVGGTTIHSGLDVVNSIALNKINSEGEAKSLLSSFGLTNDEIGNVFSSGTFTVNGNPATFKEYAKDLLSKGANPTAVARLQIALNDYANYNARYESLLPEKNSEERQAFDFIDNITSGRLGDDEYSKDIKGIYSTYGINADCFFTVTYPTGEHENVKVDDYQKILELSNKPNIKVLLYKPGRLANNRTFNGVKVSDKYLSSGGYVPFSESDSNLIFDRFKDKVKDAISVQQDYLNKTGAINDAIVAIPNLGFETWAHTEYQKRYANSSMDKPTFDEFVKGAKEQLYNHVAGLDFKSYQILSEDDTHHNFVEEKDDAKKRDLESLMRVADKNDIVINQAYDVSRNALLYQVIVRVKNGTDVENRKFYIVSGPQDKYAIDFLKDTSVKAKRDAFVDARTRVGRQITNTGVSFLDGKGLDAPNSYNDPQAIEEREAIRMLQDAKANYDMLMLASPNTYDMARLEKSYSDVIKIALNKLKNNERFGKIIRQMTDTEKEALIENLLTQYTYQ